MTCENCKKEFEKTGNNQKFCSLSCKQFYYRAGVNYCQECLQPLVYENRNKLKARKYCEECAAKITRRKNNEYRRKVA